MANIQNLNTIYRLEIVWSISFALTEKEISSTFPADMEPTPFDCLEEQVIGNRR